MEGKVGGLHSNRERQAGIHLDEKWNKKGKTYKGRIKFWKYIDKLNRKWPKKLEEIQLKK